MQHAARRYMPQCTRAHVPLRNGRAAGSRGAAPQPGPWVKSRRSLPQDLARGAPSSCCQPRFAPHLPPCAWSPSATPHCHIVSTAACTHLHRAHAAAGPQVADDQVGLALRLAQHPGSLQAAEGPRASPVSRCPGRRLKRAQTGRCAIWGEAERRGGPQFVWAHRRATASNRH